MDDVNVIANLSYRNHLAVMYWGSVQGRVIVYHKKKYKTLFGELVNERKSWWDTIK